MIKVELQQGAGGIKYWCQAAGGMSVEKGTDKVKKKLKTHWDCGVYESIDALILFDRLSVCLIQAYVKAPWIDF